MATLGLVVGGFAVHRRFGAIRFLLWMSVLVLLAWSLASAPFLVPSALDSCVDWADYLTGLLVTSGLTLGLLLPLLLLSFLQPFYRNRFLAFLNVS